MNKLAKSALPDPLAWVYSDDRVLHGREVVERLFDWFPRFIEGVQSDPAGQARIAIACARMATKHGLGSERDYRSAGPAGLLDVTTVSFAQGRQAAAGRRARLRAIEAIYKDRHEIRIIGRMRAARKSDSVIAARFSLSARRRKGSKTHWSEWSVKRAADRVLKLNVEIAWSFLGHVMKALFEANPHVSREEAVEEERRYHECNRRSIVNGYVGHLYVARQWKIAGLDQMKGPE
jgi:hypothetical protein